VGGATNTGKMWKWSPEAAENEINTLTERRATGAKLANERAAVEDESLRR
jgi:hypothetical protein